MRYSAKWPEYARWWDEMAAKPGRAAEFDADAARIIRNKARYQAIEAKTGVPWYMIGVLHLRESDMDFDTYLGNGEPLDRKTRLVPRGRGPFATFEDGAVDALRLDGLADVKDWRLEKVLYYCEVYNGSGYDARGLPSPYLWGGTSVQRPGKYVSDGKFNGRTWDSQPGCAPILAAIAKQDSSVIFQRET